MSSLRAHYSVLTSISSGLSLTILCGGVYCNITKCVVTNIEDLAAISVKRLGSDFRGDPRKEQFA